MRGVISHILAGIVAVLTWGFIAPPVGLSLVFGGSPAAGASPAVSTQSPAPVQYVDRTHKGDRLRLPTTIGKQQTPAASPAALVGCEPAVSPLSTHAMTADRCIV